MMANDDIFIGEEDHRVSTPKEFIFVIDRPFPEPAVRA